MEVCSIRSALGGVSIREVASNGSFFIIVVVDSEYCSGCVYRTVLGNSIPLHRWIKQRKAFSIQLLCVQNLLVS